MTQPAPSLRNIPLVRLGPGGDYVKDYTPNIGGDKSPLRSWARGAWMRLRALVGRAWRAWIVDEEPNGDE